MNSAGFTLLELMIVLVVLSTLVGVSLPHLRLGGIDSATAARDVAAGLATARAQAIAGGRPATFSIDLASGQFGVAGGRGGTVPADLSVRVSGPANAASGSVRTITFYPDGGATGGRLSVVGRGRDAEIEVDWLTGAIRRAP
jgi:general secretion pathway protein H